MPGSPGFPKISNFNIEDFSVKIRYSGVDMNEVFLLPGIVVSPEHT